MDPNLDPKSEDFKMAATLLASAVVGPNVGRLKAFTRYPLGLLKKVSTRMRENGIFVKGKLHVEWLEKETGGIAFWLDVACAKGYIARSTGDNGKKQISAKA